MKIETTEIRAFRNHKGIGREGDAWSGTLYVNGKRCCAVKNDGNGGSNDLDLAWGSEVRQALEEYAKALPPWEDADLGPLAMDLDFHLSLLAERAEEEAWIKRSTKRKTIFRLVGDSPGEWRTINARGGKVEAFIRTKYGEAVETIR